MRVLVADDDEDVRVVVAALLTRAGFSVTTVPHGEAALATLAQDRFDVLVLDERMPPGSGSEVVHALREGGDPTPAVLFTGFAPAEEPAGDGRLVVLDKADVRRLPEVVAELAGAG